MLKTLSQSIKSNWKRTLSGLLAVITIMGMLPATALAAEGTATRAAVSAATPVYAPTGDFEVNIAGATGWNGTCLPLPVYNAESGGSQVASVPASDNAKPIPFAVLAYNGGDIEKFRLPQFRVGKEALVERFIHRVHSIGRTAQVDCCGAVELFF